MCVTKNQSTKNIFWVTDFWLKKAYNGRTNQNLIFRLLKTIQPSLDDVSQKKNWQSNFFWSKLHGNDFTSDRTIYEGATVSFFITLIWCRIKLNNLKSMLYELLPVIKNVNKNVFSTKIICVICVLFTLITPNNNNQYVRFFPQTDFFLNLLWVISVTCYSTENNRKCRK